MSPVADGGSADRVQFAVEQTTTEYPQATAHYVPSTGYFPLPWWAGFALLGAYTMIVTLIASAGTRRRHRLVIADVWGSEPRTA
ncbi:hypothetical protein E1258_03255 [Micromonospora sp. KC207]|uniref:hypothetical protein n=1 Tax=Micromonospora sp. KC207 TaxID=2530377 RepID=UPI00104D45B5|nr:hypothetical protein [Micromonospora sp. KC207]TDC66255.1 hypothetical protein E1258_03255 [Micromonospora sp. KC207]